MAQGQYTRIPFELYRDSAQLLLLIVTGTLYIDFCKCHRDIAQGFLLNATGQCTGISFKWRRALYRDPFKWHRDSFF